LRRPARSCGFTLIELLFAATLATILVSLAVPAIAVSMNRSRTLAAARYLSGQMALARTYAVARSTNVALRFNWDGRDASIQMFRDGNGNGVGTADIGAGTDVALNAAVTLSGLFPGVAVGTPDGSDPVRIGSSNLLSFTPLGTATAGTIYVAGKELHLAVRVLGATGRTRVLRYDPRAGADPWVDSF
jgi:prepilin-type N-terminal cleavage/methylation domain-containing protein